MASRSDDTPLFLVTNDDGVHAPGVRAMAAALQELGEVVIVAPHVERSASSHAITIAQPLRVEEIQKNIFAVEGTPADCVMLAIRRILTRKPSWVISGINRGANLGVDTIYSGTVGAAMEGAIMGYRAIAVSSLGKPKDVLHYGTAAQIVLDILKNASALSFPEYRHVININVPNLSYNSLKGLKVASLGRRLYDEEMVQGVDPRGRAYFWIGAGGTMFEDIPGSDCLLTNQGYATLSVLRPSLLDWEATERLQDKLSILDKRAELEVSVDDSKSESSL